MEECVFCHKEWLSTDIIYEDELIMAFMDMEPINEGHVLIVPKEHYLDVGHYHLHVFPRYKNDGFGWQYGSDEKNVNAEIAKRIRDRIGEL